MKRAGNLTEKIADMDNLRAAFWKASRGGAGNRCVAAFRENLEENLSAIRREWLAGTPAPCTYSSFTIHDPKERKIHAPSFRDRVVQHAVMNVCDKVFEDAQIYDSYASRRGKGTDACLRRAAEYARRYDFFLKFDIRKYFDSVEHGVLKSALARRFKDRTLLGYFFDVIDGYEASRERGIPIGSLASQYFANLYLARLDRFCKETLRVPGYVRYMDDFLLFFNDGARAAEARERVPEFVEEALSLKCKPVVCNTTEHGATFLGYRVKRRGITLSQKSRRRFAEKMKIAGREENSVSATSLLAFVRRAETRGLRMKMFFGHGSEGFVPRESRRELEQPRSELPFGESRLQFAGQPQRRLGVSCLCSSEIDGYRCS